METIKYILISALLICCSTLYAHTIPVQHFEAIDVDGYYNITVNKGPRSSVTVLSGMADYVSIYTEGNTLYLRLNLSPQELQQFSECPPINVRITLPYLQSISAAGNSTVKGNHINSNYLTINTRDNSQVVLNGLIGVSSIDAGGSSRVDLRWVNSHRLTIRANDESSINLAGVAGLTDARLAGEASLDIRYLRNKTLLILTLDNATANVQATEDLYAFASNHSNIYYYKTPLQYADETELSGNSLQMGYWN